MLLFTLLSGYTVSVTSYEKQYRQSARMEDIYGSKEKRNGTPCKAFYRMH